MIMNIFENFIPHKTISFNDKRNLFVCTWRNKQIKALILEKNALNQCLMQKILNPCLPTKARNNLKLPETTWNNLHWPKATWNDL